MSDSVVEFPALLRAQQHLAATCQTAQVPGQDLVRSSRLIDRAPPRLPPPNIDLSLPSLRCQLSGVRRVCAAPGGRSGVAAIRSPQSLHPKTIQSPERGHPSRRIP